MVDLVGGLVYTLMRQLYMDMGNGFIIRILVHMGKNSQVSFKLWGCITCTVVFFPLVKKTQLYLFVVETVLQHDPCTLYYLWLRS